MMILSGLMAALLALAPVSDADLPVNERLEMTQLDAGVWMHTSYRDLTEAGVTPANGLVVERADSVVLIDTPWSEAATLRLLDWVKSTTEKPVKLVIVTHSHEDSTAGLPVTKAAGAASLGLDQTARILMSEGRGGLDIGAVGQGFGVEDGFDGMEVFYPGAAHAPDNIVVYVNRAKLIFGGCMIRAGEAGTLGNTADADIGHWAEAAEAVAKRFPQAETIVPGHGGPGTRDLLTHTADLARAAQDP